MAVSPSLLLRRDGCAQDALRDAAIGQRSREFRHGAFQALAPLAFALTLIFRIIGEIKFLPNHLVQGVKLERHQINLHQKLIRMLTGLRGLAGKVRRFSSEKFDQSSLAMVRLVRSRKK